MYPVASFHNGLLIETVYIGIVEYLKQDYEVISWGGPFNAMWANASEPDFEAML